MNKENARKTKEKDKLNGVLKSILEQLKKADKYFQRGDKKLAREIVNGQIPIIESIKKYYEHK